MENIIIETVVQIVVTLLITLIGVLGTWLTTMIAKKHELTNIAAATDEATKAAQTTVLELQQTTVEAMKAASNDGKLTQSEIEELGALLLKKALDKMSNSAINVLTSAGVDINAVIKGTGEALINRLKN